MCAGSREWVGSRAALLFFPLAASSCASTWLKPSRSVRLRVVGTRRCSKLFVMTSRDPPSTRNLFHISAAICDAWAVFDDVAVPYLLGNRIGFFACGFSGVEMPTDRAAAREEAINYAAYRLLVHRFSTSPEARGSINSFRTLLTELGYNPGFTSTDYSDGSPAALGNYIARCMIDFGLQDGSNESGGYASTAYRPVNPPLRPADPGNPELLFFNRWQSLSLQFFIDQSGHLLPGNTPPFFRPRVGKRTAFRPA